MAKKMCFWKCQERKKINLWHFVLVEYRFFILLVILVWTSGCASMRQGKELTQGDVPIESNEAPSPKEAVTQNKKTTGHTVVLEPKSHEDLASYHFSMGQAYSLDGEVDQAIEEYKVALIHDPNSALVRTRLATEYVKKGLLTFAIDECKQAVQMDPKYVDARLLLAGLYSSTRLVQEAISEYDAVIKVDPKNNEAYVFKGSLLLDEGRNKEAIDVLKTLVKREPSYYLGYYYLGRVYQKIENNKMAVRSYKKALEIRPSFTQAGLMLGVLFEETNQVSEALKVYRSLYQESGDLQAVSRLAQIHIDRSEFNEALKYLLVLADNDTNNLNVRVKIGLIYIEQKNYDAAIQTFESILENVKDAQRVRYYLASIYEEQERYDKAIEEFQKINSSSVMYIDALIHVAHLYKLKGDVSSAIEWTEKAIGKNPKAVQLYLYKVSLLEEQKNYKEAIKSLEETRIFFPHEERVLYFLGSMYDKIGDTDKGLEIMHELLEINPNNVHALNYIGYTWVTRGQQLALAEKYILMALKIKPEDGYIQDSYGYLLLMKGEVAQATRQLEKAHQLTPEEPVILEHLGDAYLRGNLNRKALLKYKKAEELYTEAKEKEKIQVKINNLKKKLGLLPMGVKETSRLPASNE